MLSIVDRWLANNTSYTSIILINEYILTIDYDLEDLKYFLQE